MIHFSNTFVFTELQTYLNHLKCTIFSTIGVRSVKSFKYMCCGFLYCVFGVMVSFLLFLRFCFVDWFSCYFGVLELICNIQVANLLLLTLD